MNKKQRVAIIFGGILLAISLLFPPLNGSDKSFVGYRYINDSKLLFSEYHILTSQLFIQYITIVTITIGMVFVFKDNK